MHTVERHRKKITDDGIVDAKIPNDFIRASEMKTFVAGGTGNMRLKGNASRSASFAIISQNTGLDKYNFLFIVCQLLAWQQLSGSNCQSTNHTLTFVSSHGEYCVNN